MQKISLLIVGTFLFSCLLFAQNNTRLDSLKKIISSNSDDQQKVKAYSLLCEITVTNNFQDCIHYAEEGIALASKSKDSIAIGNFIRSIGSAEYFKGNYDKAGEKFYQALHILQSKPVSNALSEVYNNLGRLYRKSRDLDRAAEMYDLAYDVCLKLNDKAALATILNESGVVFEYKEDYKEAINRYQQSLNIREETNDTEGKAYSLNFIGGAYTAMKKFDKAEEYLLQSLALREQMKDTFAMALNYSDLGAMYAAKGDVERSISNFEKSNAFAVQLHYTELRSANYKELSNVYEAKTDYRTALEFYKKHTAVHDSVFNTEKTKQIEELNMRYETEKKDSKINEQRLLITKRNYIIFIVAGLFVLGLILAYLFYNRYKLKQQAKLQQEILYQQDISTRAVIAAEENERKRIAAELHDGVGQMMSAVKMNLSAFENELQFNSPDQKTAFEKAISLVDESCKEVRSVSHQMMPNALLKSGLANAVKAFIDKIDSHILKINLHTEGLDERLDSNTETVLYRVLQECVNNVIKHSGANQLDIAIIKDKDGISATVEDNGNGFDVNDKQKFDGIGLKNIITRISYLKGTVDFDSAPGRGTLVAIHVPGN